MLNGKSVLVTGGTGSFGRKFTEIVLDRYQPRRLIVFSRDELKQHEMARQLSPKSHDCLRYFLGDVRDRERLYRALDGVDVVVHAAALKQVPSCEYNPLEAIKTNILGAANLVDAAIDRRVQKVIALSTDKATNPINLYGATKLCSDKLLIGANHYVGRHQTQFAAVRYGNVVGSRGSVVPLFVQMRRRGVIPITDPRMTRFWITVEQGVEFVLASLQRMSGGEIFVPKIPSMNIVDLAQAVAPRCRTETVGMRPGEKLHETLICEEDARHTLEHDDYFAILPDPDTMAFSRKADPPAGRPCPDGFRYSSHTNPRWLSIEQLQKMVGSIQERNVA